MNDQSVTGPAIDAKVLASGPPGAVLEVFLGGRRAREPMTWEGTTCRTRPGEVVGRA